MFQKMYKKRALKNFGNTYYLFVLQLSGIFIFDAGYSKITGIKTD